MLDEHLLHLRLKKVSTNNNIYLRINLDGLLIIEFSVDAIIDGGNNEVSNKFLMNER